LKFLRAPFLFNGLTTLHNKTIVVDERGFINDICNFDEVDNLKVQFFDGALCPGFVNTHCHLELSYLKNKIETNTGLDVFIKKVEELRRNFDEERLQAIVDANIEMYNNGIVAVGDICNGDSTFSTKIDSKIIYYNFIEVFAFHPSRAESVFEGAKTLFKNAPSPKSITPHAPYSASDLLLQKINNFALLQKSILTIHNQESKDENLMFQNKQGKVFERLKSFGIETDFWNATGESSLVTTIQKLPNKLPLQLVHNTFTSKADIDFANSYNKNIYWCFCVNANKFIENNMPNINQFITANCAITIGTDSLASNWSLNMLDELKCISNKFEHTKLETQINWATLNGAKYLGFDTILGSIEIGKKPGINFISSIENEQLTKQSTVTKIV